MNAMNWTDYTEDQVIQILRLAATGVKPVDICGRFGVPVTVFRSWQAKYGMPDADFRDQRLCELDDENTRLKKLVADLTLECHALRRRLGEGH